MLEKVSSKITKTLEGVCQHDKLCLVYVIWRDAVILRKLFWLWCVAFQNRLPGIIAQG